MSAKWWHRLFVATVFAGIGGVGVLVYCVGTLMSWWA